MPQSLTGLSFFLSLSYSLTNRTDSHTSVVNCQKYTHVHITCISFIILKPSLNYTTTAIKKLDIYTVHIFLDDF